MWFSTLLVLRQEQEERKEMESAVNALKRRLATIKEKCASVDAEIEQYRSMVATLERGERLPYASNNRHWFT